MAISVFSYLSCKSVYAEKKISSPARIWFSSVSNKRVMERVILFERIFKNRMHLKIKIIRLKNILKLTIDYRRFNIAR